MRTRIRIEHLNLNISKRPMSFLLQSVYKARQGGMEGEGEEKDKEEEGGENKYVSVWFFFFQFGLKRNRTQSIRILILFRKSASTPLRRKKTQVV